MILHMASEVAPELPVFTLDTGRLPDATYRMIETVRERYGITVRMIPPDAGELERMTAAHGPNLFRQSVSSRLLCCQVRKVRPLAKAMAGFEATLVGLRREQGESREGLEQIDWRTTPVKLAPLAGWRSADVIRYSVQHGVPEHPLYAQGYRSIGCEPCTRSVQPADDERAGRWWWENDTVKECGLHFTPDGRVQRGVDILLNEVIQSAPV